MIPLGVVSHVDPNLKDATGYNVDLGYRGTVKNILNFDFSLFYMAYNNRIGLELKPDGSGGFYTYRTNIANSIHKGLEGYGEFNISKLFSSPLRSKLSLFNSIMLLNAEYKNGPFKGKTVEYAPSVINRVGLTWSYKIFSTTLQHSYQGSAFGDADNTIVPCTNGVVGKIPAYAVIDWSTTFSWKKISLKTGVNNLTNSKYFSYRTDEYPGPGIIPAIGRSIYLGVTARF